MRSGSEKLAGFCTDCGACWRCLCANLPKKALDKLCACTQTQFYSKDASIFRQEEPARGVFLVHQGWVKLYHLRPSGRSAIVNLVGRSGLVGLPEVVAGSLYQLNAVALEKCVLEFFPRHTFVAFLLQHPQVAVELLIRASEEIGRLTAILCESTERLSPSKRLLHALEELWNHEEGGPSGEAPFHLTVQDLADRIGCSRQWTSKLLKELAEKGLILRQGQRICPPSRLAHDHRDCAPAASVPRRRPSATLTSAALRAAT